MLNLPFVTQPSVTNETTATKNAPKPKQEKDDFSKTYEASDKGDDRPSEDVKDTRTPDQDQDNTAPKEADSRPDKDGRQAKSDGQDTPSETPEDADFVAVEVAQTVHDVPEVAPADAETKVAKGATENAALMKLATQASDTAKQVVTGQAQTQTTDAKQIVLPEQAAPKAVDAVQMANAQSGKLVAETGEGLDPMRVSVRSQVNQQAAQAAPQQIVQEVAAQDAGRRGAVKQSVEAVEEPTAPKLETPSVPTTSTTQQLQARAIMEQVNAGVPQMNNKAADIQASQNLDMMIAAADESTNSSRSIMSSQEAASQARLTNSAPNPAYVVRQVADAFKMSDKNLIELAMDPPELGKVRMSMSEAGGVMTVNIAAESQATTELMRRHIDMLRKDFMEMGYKDVAFSFEQQGSGGQDTQSGNDFGQGGQGGHAQGDVALMADAATLAAQQATPQTLVSSGLDIRV
ncbi:flagellar hook-length control protein FliK [Shimia sagamensis]|uniref:Flagellar hook-length control protein FliK n=1 Tax=Shimia sagamensis TaxID=1566352 RepID=A0ABY1NEV1_9RHOB|nr:flagellar hook-length control protein FliK [Shimia sagamensis]SMP07463.1 Flagellar hook-length control protein FliK [Shimia sagamensis]